MKSSLCFAILVAVGFFASACGHAERTDADASGPPIAVEKPFATGGRIDVHLDGGSYEVRPATDARIRVTSSGNTGKAKAAITIDGANAAVSLTDTPNNFHATIDVPRNTDLVIRLTGGELTVGAIGGNTDVESSAGNVTIAVTDPNDYASVDASIKAGEIQASMFGGSKSGLLQHLTWSGNGKHTLRANLGAGNLVFRSQ